MIKPFYPLTDIYRMQIPKKIPLEHVEKCANVWLEDVRKINEIIDYLEYQKSYQYCEANKDTFNKELAIKLLESIVSNSTPRLDNDWYNLMKDSYEQLLNMLQKSYQSSNSYIWKNVKAFKCHKNWRELWALDDYPLWVDLVEEIVSENKLWFYFRSWDIICQFYSDVEEIIQSEDKPIANEHDFWEAIMLLKDVRQYATDMTSHADSYEAQSAYKKYKKLLSILENKIFTI